MNKTTENIYIAPSLEVMTLEVEQNIMGASLEEIDGENPEQLW